MVFLFSICIIVINFLFSLYFATWVLSKDEGPPAMAQLSYANYNGAEGFFRTQYGIISKKSLLLALVILCIYFFHYTTPHQEYSGIRRATSAHIIVVAFLLEALCSSVAGYVGMWVSVPANIRVSSAARRWATKTLWGIHEDDSRNPTVVADLVGDNVVHSFDLVIALVGNISIKSTRDSVMKDPIEDFVKILQRSYSITILLAVLTIGMFTCWLPYTDQAPSPCFEFVLCGFVDILAAHIFV
ncbi:hypothetical protein Nepgr_007197 [Nepenthes gracilis]|uniref:H(+)-exporting diphosphatase n=1 Tax=Nepenthes gracilis TaxID=150966 RepID=A0AAD3S789_NEPGR|nr:hypothetical protein Nepgr_007197 [Nepenthes gracilis]